MTSSRTQCGFSLVELMIALTIGLLILAGLTATFMNSNRTRSEIEKVNRQIENGRFAMDMLTEELRIAGYYGELDVSRLTAPLTTPDPCQTGVAALKAALPIVIQGYDESNSLSCLSDVKTGTDVIVVRRASTCYVGEAGTNCDAVQTSVPYLQVALCNTQSATPFDLNTDTSLLTLNALNCTAAAPLRRYRTHIYFIANNDQSGDGIPTLKRAELGAGGFTIVPLVEGIENMQVEYGIDTNCDGTADLYNASPDTYTATYSASCVAPNTPNWKNVTSVKLNLLARNTEQTPGYTDTKTYVLGSKADGTSNSYGPFSDSYKRHVYQASIRLANAAGRKQ
ncbi:PilW family protein [Noviherbaspirillum galbum]|uniref:Prepilin-type N-terminal cleavage/methylation domain-containing protein n=1 Tax=Noviherbaspirillum galbum TaxID=2709383 RepID=A0A6B3SHE0_9BURK|nr:PilW family protein [Noviherbaspirillum galbum]NEX60291.1 prepilin-type N-terminal cleavage/methylation domain-containing protein [Noviherbaspirillum galbum]